MMDADFDSDPTLLQALAEAHAFELGCPEEEIGSVVKVVAAVLQHPILKAASGAAITHKEYPLLFQDVDGRIVEGNIDLVYQQGEEWIIVDFKTGSADRSEYRKQVQVYARALEPRSVRAILFEICADETRQPVRPLHNERRRD